MRKRSSPAWRIEFAPLSLPDRFPLQHIRQKDHSDAPIHRLHFHDCLEIGLCHAGSGLFVIGEKVMPFHAGDVTVIAESEPHYARSVRGTTSDWTWIWLDPPRLLGRSNPGATWLSTQPLTGRQFANVFAREEGEGLDRIAATLIQELAERRTGWHDASRGLLTTLLCKAHRRAAPAQPAPSTDGLHRLGPALDFLATRYADAVSLEQLARLCGMSLSHFRRLFRQVFGKSPHAYLLELRVRAAAAALRDPRKRITEAAFDAGFTTLSTFNRAFLAIIGEAPRSWRRNEPVEG